MENISKYDLTDEEYKECLKKAEMAVFLNAKSSSRPTSIFVVAQPGAGKNGLRAHAINDTQDKGYFGNYVEFNPDAISLYHKYYNEILENCPDESHKILQKFTFNALDHYLRQRAVELRCNIMQEGTFRSDGYIDILNFQKNGGKIQKIGKDKSLFVDVEGGYNIQIDVLAVNRYESLLSSFEREYGFIVNNLPPRPVTVENHDDSYEKMLKTIDVVERKLFDEMYVYKRGLYHENKPELIYQAGDKRFPSTSEAVRYERHRQEVELFNNPEAYLNRISELKEKVKEVGNMNLLNRIEFLEKDFLIKLDKNKNKGYYSK